MTDKEMQEEEREVLLSIYDGDVAFKQLAEDTFQYKYGENDDIKSFLVEIKWGDTYPTQKPEINMDTFYNKHVIESVKDRIKTFLLDEAEQYLGAAMTYTLFEGVKEKLDELLDGQPESFVSEISESIEKVSLTTQAQETSKKAPKKEQLSKAQKRKQWDRSDGRGDMPRGWNWVDIVKHLSQTGSKDDSPPPTS